MAYRKRTVEDKFVLFDDAVECAKAAAPVFIAQRWRWTFVHGIPKEHHILDTLLQLKEMSDEAGTDHSETGRLIYWQGKFGYERPREKQL